MNLLTELQCHYIAVQTDKESMTAEVCLAIEHYILFAKKGRTGLSNEYLLHGL